MKKILFSLGTIAVVAAVAIGGTVAFYNDTETSTGNVFTAGSIDLTIDSNGSSYNGKDLLGTNFGSRNLTDEHFFVFEDIKPGDWGVRDISMHVESNPAYACLLLTNKSDEDNSITDPEDEVDSVIDNADGTADGDLSRELQLFVWEDLNNDQDYDPQTGEPALAHDGGVFDTDSFFDITYETIFDSQTGAGPLVPNDVRNIALAWCAGDQTVNHVTGEITCDGSGMSDIAQTDSFTADVVLYAEQVRNNGNFTCADVELGENGDEVGNDDPSGFPGVGPT